MKLKTIFFIALSFLGILFTSCRDSALELIETPTDKAITLDSNLTTLITQTTLKDGSADNIIDKSSSTSVQLPVEVIANSIKLTIQSQSDFQQIEDLFDLSVDDEDTLVITFPITVTFADYAKKELKSYDELEEIVSKALGQDDDDIECVDFQYPISFSVFNQNNELAETVELNSDEELYAFLLNLGNYTAVSLNFPINLINYDGTISIANSAQEVENIILANVGMCDEDDDNDYDDDDCTSCTTAAIDSLLVSCKTFKIDHFKLNEERLDSLYRQYTFSFDSNAVLTVTDQNASTTTGTWTAQGSGNDISISLVVEGLDLLNRNWRLHELEIEGDETELSLRDGQNRLKFESTCGNNSNDDDNSGSDDD